MNFVIFFTISILLLSVKAVAYETKLLTPVPGAQEYEFAFYPGGVEKIIKSTGPFVDSKNLPLGEYKYRHRIKKNNQWSPWSKTSKIRAWKRAKSLKQDKPASNATTLSLKQFLYGLSRSLEAENDGVIKKTSESALRIGASLDSKYYKSQAFYETGKTFNRIDLGAMKVLSPKLQIGGKLIFVSADFKNSRGSAKINGTHAFIQATGKHRTQNGYLFSLTGAGTLQGSVLAHLDVSKSWTVNKKLKLSPTFGYEHLNLKSSDTRLNSTSFLAGVFAEFSF